MLIKVKVNMPMHPPNADNKQLAPSKLPAGGGDDGPTPANPRRFTSDDPLVADLANKIEARYPGHVVGVNQKIRDARGRIVTDIDIELQNANIQVKSGEGKGLTRQVIKTQAISDKPIIAFGPNLGRHVQRSVARRGALVTTDENLLLEVIKP
ncbi:hypothetical protein HYR99_11910 [Candidatus Poribacteria bacterium]|nr:hypothetical protein [Candidatus Poribacteria bacterium]